MRVQQGAWADQLQSVYLAWKEFVGNAFSDITEGRKPPGIYMLVGRDNDAAWLDFLSVKSISHFGMTYKDGMLQPTKLAPPYDHLKIENSLDTRHADALFVPGGFQPKPNPFFKIHCALGQFGPGRSLGLVKEGAVALFPPGVRENDLVAVFDVLRSDTVRPQPAVCTVILMALDSSHWVN